MLSSSVKLPLADAFELKNPAPPPPSNNLAPELEDALMSALEAMGAGRTGAGSMGAGSKPAAVAPAPPAAALPPPARELPAPTVSIEAPAPVQKMAAEAPRSAPDPLDPQMVARRVAQLRRPFPRSESVPRPPRPAEPAVPRPPRSESPGLPQSRWEPPLKAAPAPEAPPAPAAPQSAGYAPGPNRSRPLLRPIAAEPRRPAPPAAAAQREAPEDQARLNDAAERTLRGWSVGDDLVSKPPARYRQPARLGIVGVAALLLVGAGGGTMVLQWLAPRDPAIAATAPVAPMATVTVASVAPKTLIPVPVATTSVAPAAAAPTQTAALPPAAQPAAAALPPPAQVVAPASVETKPPILAAPRVATVAPSAHPSWYVEDDPTAIEPATAAAAGKRMRVTADVDVRTSPDATTASMGILKQGAVIAVGDCNQWCAVSIDGRTGWVFSAFLSDATAIR